MLTVALATVTFALGAAPAGALVAKLADGRTVSYQPLRGAARLAAPLDSVFSNLDYNGGPVMPQNINYVIFWAPAGSTAYPADYQPGIERYFSDLAAESGTANNVDSVAAQYNDAAGNHAAYSSHFGGAFVDSNPYPANGCKRAPICLTDQQLRTELLRFAKSHELPTNLEHEYFLLTPPGVEDCFEAGGRECSAGTEVGTYCAYHGSVPAPEGPLIYANDPYVTGITGCDTPADHPNGSSDGALMGGLSHEHNESITDPEPNSAWANTTEGGTENGDKCRTFNEAEFGTSLGTAPDGSPYNQVINGDLYYYQQEWSNQTHQCLQRLAISGEAPTAKFTAAPAGTKEVSFDATGSSAPGGITRYDWQFEGSQGPATTVETTTAKTKHLYLEAGYYRVALTIFASDGTSTGTAQTITVGTPAAPVLAKVSPTKGPASGNYDITLTGTGFRGATAVHMGGRSVPFVVQSPTTIVLTAPETGAGVAAVTVTTPAGTSGALAVKLAPVVAALAPASGPRAGGTTLTVTGAGFSTAPGGTVIKFGTVKGTGVSCASSTQCTVVTPAHAAGTLDVLVTAGKVASAKSSADRFTFE